jgi:hypothetical protein
MESNTLDSVTERLKELLQQRERFQVRYDLRAAEYLEALPSLYRLFHWLTFDLEIPAEPRRKAASIAVYIAESHDFRGESNLDVDGLIDDVWLAYTGLNQLARTVPVEALQRHWRSDIPFFQVLDLSRSAQELEAHLPSRVLGLLQKFIA